MSDLNFYRDFEDKYRGSRALIKERLRAYTLFLMPLLELYPAGLAVDLGCGRGEWLELLAELGFTPYGVDIDDGMLAACRALGLSVDNKDIIAALRDFPDNSQAIVSAFHVVEHIPFETLLTLVKEAMRVLKPAGLLILETPNPENVAVGTANFYIDPTHQRPLPAPLLSFLPEYVGFYRTKVARLQEAKALHTKDDISLNDVLFGVSPDFSVIAQKSGRELETDLFDLGFSEKMGIDLGDLASRFDATVDRKNAELKELVLRAETQAAQAKAYAQAELTHAEQRWQALMGQELARSAQLERKIEESRQITIDLEMQKRELQTVLDGIYESKSWRLTTPARLMNKWLQEAKDKKFHYQNKLLFKMKNSYQRWIGIVFHLFDEKILRKTLLRSKINRWMFIRFPGLHYKIRRIIKVSKITREPKLHKQSPEQVMPIESALDLRRTQILSSKSLLIFERPTQNLEAYRIVSTNKTVEKLIAVHDLNEVRQSPASVCFVLTVDNNSEDQLRWTLNSILSQTDPAWEVILCGSGEYDELISLWLDIDWRIRRAIPDEYKNIAAQLIDVAASAFAEYIGVISQGDSVDCDLVRLIGNECSENHKPDLIYTDQAQNRCEGESIDRPWFKPDWSPEHMYSVNLLGRFLAIKKKLILNYPAPPKNISNQSAEYWLGLKVATDAKSINHIDEALYISARSDTSSVGGLFSIDAVGEVASILESHIESQGMKATVRQGIIDGSLYVDWPIPKGVDITLLILTGMYRRKIPAKGEVVLAENFVRSIIEKSGDERYKILVVHDGEISESFQALLEENGHASASYHSRGPFSFAHKANFAVSLVKSGVIILLNDDLEVINPNWIRALVGQAVRQEIGVVGGSLLFDDNTLQHAGLVVGVHGTAGHIFHRFPSDLREYGGYASITRNYSAVTGAVMAFRKEVFETIGGFDEAFQTDYNDVDFCLRCIKYGYRVVYNPMASLYHFHNSSLKRIHDHEDERAIFVQRWASIIEKDPFYSKHFQTESSDLPLLLD